jgi:hypothetical protein
MWLGAVAIALVSYARFLRQPGRWLRAPEVTPCCPGCDPYEARDQLAVALKLLAAGPRADLLRVIRPLDDELRRRTLPSYPPVPYVHGLRGRWWRDRHMER